jgi:hypothetical protein
LIESYNIIFLDQFEGYYKNENHREVQNTKFEEALKRQQQAIEK